MKVEYHLYLTDWRCNESHAINICNTSDLAKIKEAIVNIIKTAHIGNESAWWWYGESVAEEAADKFTDPFEHALDKDAAVTKKKFEFYNIGFIITNLAMWPDNKGGYEKDFCY